MREKKSLGCCQVSVSRRKSSELSRMSSWRMGALLLSERVLRRAKLDEWEGGVMGARWRGLRLAGSLSGGVQ